MFIIDKYEHDFTYHYVKNKEYALHVFANEINIIRILEECWYNILQFLYLHLILCKYFMYLKKVLSYFKYYFSVNLVNNI